MKFIFFLFTLLPLAAGAQVITTFAGNGVDSYSGDGALATSAGIGVPGGIYIDASGDIYFTSFSKHTLRKVSPTGVITTLCGNGTAGSTGDGGPATAGKMNGPVKMARDAAGNFYIAERAGNRIRKISASGIISTLAGTGTAGYSGDGGQATLARLNEPTGVCVDASGNVYVADLLNHRIRKISPSGIITTIAGTGTGASTGDGGMAAAASLFHCHGVICDAAGNLYIAEASANKIRKISTSGIITTVVGSGLAGYSGDGGPATAAKLKNPGGVTLDAVGNLYVSDQFNHVIRKVSTSGIIVTLAGSNVLGYSGDGGPATAARLNHANEMAISASGQIYINDNNNFRIRSMDICANDILAHPVHDTEAVGDTAHFTVLISGMLPTYQWQADTGTGFYNLPAALPYLGVNTNSLTVCGVDTTLDSVYFRCITTSGESCPATSNPAILRVNEECNNAILMHPLNDTGFVGDTAYYTVTTSGLLPSYRWQADTGTGFYDLSAVLPYSGVTTNTLAIYGIDTSLNGAYYRCITTSGDGICPDTSNAGIQRVDLRPTAISSVKNNVVDAKVWPNPVSANLMVELQQTEGWVRVEICSITGAVIGTYTTKGGGVVNIDVNHLPRGIYMVRIYYDGMTSWHKISKL